MQVLGAVMTSFSPDRRSIAARSGTDKSTQAPGVIRCDSRPLMLSLFSPHANTCHLPAYQREHCEAVS